jgi:hypothetical protein
VVRGHQRQDRLEAAHRLGGAAGVERVAGAIEEILGAGHLARADARVLARDHLLVETPVAEGGTAPRGGPPSSRPTEKVAERKIRSAVLVGLPRGGGEVPPAHRILRLEADGGAQVRQRGGRLLQGHEGAGEPGARLGVLGDDGDEGAEQRPRRRRIAGLEVGGAAREELGRRRGGRRRGVLVVEADQIAPEVIAARQPLAAGARPAGRLGDACRDRAHLGAAQDVALGREARAQRRQSERGAALGVVEHARQRAVGVEQHHQRSPGPAAAAATHGDDGRAVGGRPDARHPGREDRSLAEALRSATSCRLAPDHSSSRRSISSRSPAIAPPRAAASRRSTGTRSTGSTCATSRSASWATSAGSAMASTSASAARGSIPAPSIGRSVARTGAPSSASKASAFMRRAGATSRSSQSCRSAEIARSLPARASKYSAQAASSSLPERILRTRSGTDVLPSASTCLTRWLRTARPEGIRSNDRAKSSKLWKDFDNLLGRTTSSVDYALPYVYRQFRVKTHVGHGLRPA